MKQSKVKIIPFRWMAFIKTPQNPSISLLFLKILCNKKQLKGV